MRGGLFIHLADSRALWGSQEPLRASLAFDLVIEIIIRTRHRSRERVLV